MTFSLRSILLVIAIVGIWLGAILSKSPLAVELATVGTNLFLLVSVALAIWHPQMEQRKFWTGFCLAGLGNFVLAHHFSAYRTSSYVIAAAVLGDPNGWQSYPPQSAMTVWAPSTTFVSPPNAPINSYVQTYDPYAAVFYTQSYQAVGAGVVSIFSLLAACIGGWLTLWIAREKAKEREQPS
jgi:hypothetical protein